MENTNHIERVYGIFKDFFGEDFVDLQEGNDGKKFILVYWPRVRVTNENDKYIDITDLYAKIRLNNDGTIPWEDRGFLLNRTSYTSEQFDRGYMHSHISHIPIENFTIFQPPCLGRGPILNTINTLKSDSDSINWMLFCQELSMYVTVESLHGVPYIRLETVGSRDDSYMYNTFSEFSSYGFDRRAQALKNNYGNDAIKDFYKWYIEKGHLKLGYRDGRFVQGMRFVDYMLDISNSFIDWVNSKHQNNPTPDWLFQNSTLWRGTVTDNGICRDSSETNRRARDYSRYVGSYVLTFKGERKNLAVVDNNSESTVEHVNILDFNIAMAILRCILININLKYGRKTEEGREGEGSTADSSEKRAYI